MTESPPGGQEPQEIRKPPKPGSDTVVDSVLGLYEFARDTGGELFLLPGPLLRDDPYIPRSFLTRDVRNLVHVLWRGMAAGWNDWAGQLTGAERKAQGITFASKVPSATTVATITEHLEALGMARGRLVTAALRAVRSNGGIVIDLGDATGKAVWVEAGKWEVRDPRDLPCEPPVFRRSTGYLPLPHPERGGDWDDFRKILRTADDDAWHRITGWSVAAYFAEVSRPGLWCLGPPGSGKTTAACAVARLIDGTEWLDGRLDRSDERNNIIRAVKSYVVSFDNMSSVTADVSDWLCNLVTGHRDTFRKMRSNFDDISMSYKRTFVATGVSLPWGLQADALDRIIEIPLSQIPEDKRCSDEQLKAELDEARPLILGALLDHVVKVLEILPRIPVEAGLGRMNGYARILIAHDVAMYGSGGTPCLNAWQASVAQIRTDRAEAEPVVAAISKLLSPVRCGQCEACRAFAYPDPQKQSCTDPRVPSWCCCPGCASQPRQQHQGLAWEGTADALRTALTAHRTYTDAPPVVDGKRTDYWPENARAMSDKLTALDSVLGAAGLRVTRRKSNGVKLVKIERPPT